MQDLFDNLKIIDFSNETDLAIHKKKVKELLNNYNNLELIDVFYLTFFFHRLKNKETSLKIGLEITDMKERTITGGFIPNGQYEPSEKKVYINQNILKNALYAGKNLKNEAGGITYVLHVIEHEMQHAIQFNNFKKDNIVDLTEIDPLTVFLAKESVANQYFNTYTKKDLNGLVNGKDDFSNYHFNYRNMLLEHDANFFGIKNTAEWLREYAPDIATDYLKENNEELTKYDYYRRYTDVLTQKNKDDEGDMSAIHKTSVIADYAMKTNPARVFKTYPVLKLIYNYDGSKKTYKELMQDKKNTEEILKTLKLDSNLITVENKDISRTSNLNYIYKAIVNSDYMLKIEELESEIANEKNDKIVAFKRTQISNIVWQFDDTFFEQFKNHYDNKIKEIQTLRNDNNKVFRKDLQMINNDDERQVLNKQYLIEDAKLAKEQNEFLKTYTINLNSNDKFKKYHDNIKSKLENDQIKKLDDEKNQVNIIKETFKLDFLSKDRYENDGVKTFVSLNVNLRDELLKNAEELVLNLENKHSEGIITGKELIAEKQKIYVARSALYDYFKENKEPKIVENQIIDTFKLSDSKNILHKIIEVEKNTELSSDDLIKLNDLKKLELSKISNILGAEDKVSDFVKDLNLNTLEEKSKTM